ncbi:MAG: glycosyltransferase [bacterium]|nr:glycosyltransferase [bacterium]
MNIFLIGPTYPYRGGIAHYTTLLYEHLMRVHSVSFVSYKRQYPAFLYPGKSDIDPDLAKKTMPEVERILDSVNPVSWIKTALKVIRNKPDLLILPWWVAFWTPQYLCILTLVKVFRRKTPVLFICHNVVEHESNWIKRFCTRLVLSFGSCFIVHAKEEELTLRSLLEAPLIKRTYIPLNELFTEFPAELQEKARAEIGIENKKVILFFGFVRPYKGLRYLLEALPAVAAGMPDIILLIVGEFWTDRQEYFELIEKYRLSNRLKIIDRYIAHDDVPKYFSAADFVVSPYVSATGSAIVQTAFGLGKPVVATNVGSLPELIEHEKTGLIVEPHNSKALAEAIIRMYQDGMYKKCAEKVLIERKKFSWERYVKSIEELYESTHCAKRRQ